MNTVVFRGYVLQHSICFTVTLIFKNFLFRDRVGVVRAADRHHHALVIITLKEYLNTTGHLNTTGNM